MNNQKTDKNTQHLIDKIEMFPADFPLNFPSDASARQQCQWIKQHFRADIANLPEDVTAGEVKTLYDKYEKPLALGNGHCISSFSVSNLSAAMKNSLIKHKLAYTPLNNTLIDSHLTSPEMNSRVLYRELERIKWTKLFAGKPLILALPLPIIVALFLGSIMLFGLFNMLGIINA